METRLGFPREWGLGSSSTLLYNIAQWAYTSPFELASHTFGGSGYDIACAGSEGPILYHRDQDAPNWSTVVFNPVFQENLYFVYLGSKQNTRESIDLYRNQSAKKIDCASIDAINRITSELVNCNDLSHFNELMAEHESIVSKAIGIDPIQKKFADFNGQLKSLGAWGGDFMLVSCEQEMSEVENYFKAKGLETVISYKDFVLPSPIKKVHHTVSEILQ